MRRLAVLSLLSMLALAPSVAHAHGGEPVGGQVPAQALAVQALAMLDAQMGATDARDRVQAALRADNQDDVRVDRLRAADRALARGDTSTARLQLEAAFNPDDRHLIGTSFTTGGDGRAIAAIIGAMLIAAALFLLRRRHGGEPRPGSRGDARLS